ncbi:omptin family outer membrane protease [Rhizobium ruizarguesonis]|uniref:omptin family outer membrane protease n=1 Tax=Rhizobium ruizarguesonis TaxID=2081791 RepID=UPI00247ABC75|nr:omptin family outer membrane protease [Rhizobium ruizarguesonis]
MAAANNALYSSDDGNFFVFGGLGLASIKAQEVVYDGDHKVSQLNWETKGMTLFTLGVGRQLDNDWSVKCSVEIGTSGNGHMVDYQWDSGGHNDWSDHSIHPLTELDHYFAGAIQLDRIIYGYETSSVTVGAGVRYTDIKWKRLWRVRHLFVRGWLPKRPLEDPDRERGTSYRQQIPIGFINLSGKYNFRDFTLAPTFRLA